MKRIILFLLIGAALQKGSGQTTSMDLELIRNKTFASSDGQAYYKGRMNSQNLMSTKRKGLASIANPVVWVCKGGMLMYQKLISPQLSRQCPYEITCSNFSKHSIEEFGLVKGLLLSADRLMRCNPFALADVDNSSINDETQKIIDYPWWYK